MRTFCVCCDEYCTNVYLLEVVIGVHVFGALRTDFKLFWMGGRASAVFVCAPDK